MRNCDIKFVNKEITPFGGPQIRNCCDKMPVWLIPIILLSLAVMMVSYFS
jgi:paraquat-inducible protein B